MKREGERERSERVCAIHVRQINPKKVYNNYNGVNTKVNIHQSTWIFYLVWNFMTIMKKKSNERYLS